jgi:ABC-type branched-subunit amino acid transport system permease subunit
VGGALMTAQIGSANIDRYDIFLSLSLLMLTVVGGIGYVSGALMGGILFGVLFVAFQNTFAKLGADYPDLNGFFEFLAHLSTVLPALLGVSVGRNPTGRWSGSWWTGPRCAGRARCWWAASRSSGWRTCWPAATPSATGG